MKFRVPEWMEGIPGAIDKLSKERTVVIANKVYSVCKECRTAIRVDKPIFGSLHLCYPDETSLE